MSAINTSRLFTASCMALTVTSMTFAIRAGMISPLGEEFKLSPSELAQITGMAFLGFPIATTLGGFFVDQIGMKRLMWVAFGAHLLGLLLTIFSGGFWGLYLSTFLVGFANGMVEAVCNPLVTSIYTKNKTVMLNKFHVWFPGGLVIGSLLAAGMKALEISWHWQVGIIIIPTLIYGWLFLGQTFPKTERVTSGVSAAAMFKSLLNPLFLFLAVCMFLTANTELTTNQWVGKLLENANANGLLILALVNGIMAVCRFYGEKIIHRLNPAGVLLASAVVSIAGLWMLSHLEGNALYGAAVVFAFGVCFFWPTMLGFVSENIPESGAMGLSIMGGVGMLGNWAFQTYYLGPNLEQNTKSLIDGGMVKETAELAAGRDILSFINIFPVVLVVLFAGLWFYMRSRQK